jgi:GxxExxY protein
MTENEIANTIVDAAYVVHCALGPGLLEHVYEIALQHELKKRGLNADCQMPIDIVYDNIRFDEGFRIDLLVGSKVIVEIKSVEDVHPKHKKTVLTYLLLADIRVLHYSSTSMSSTLMTASLAWSTDFVTRRTRHKTNFLSSFASLAPLAALRASEV